MNNTKCLRTLWNWSAHGRPVLLVAAVGLLLPAVAQAAFKSDLQGRNAGSTNWSGGPLLGWLELDYIPMRSLHTGGPVSNQVITVSFDHSKSTIPGLEDLTGFTASSNVVITAGPTLSAPPGSDIWSYSYTITVIDDQPGTVEFYGRLAAGSHLFAGSSLSLTLGGTLQISKPAAQPGDPDLAIAKAGPSEAQTNQIITYAIAYTNKWSSPDTAVGVQVSDILPPQVSYVPGSASKGAKILGNRITWDVGNLKPGARGLLTYKVMVTNNLAVTTTFANYAQILSSHDEATPADNVSSVATTVVVIPNALAADDFYPMAKNGVLTVPAPGVLLNDSNAASGVLLSAPLNGTLAFNTNGSFIYTPDTNFIGTDIFFYRAANITNLLSGPAVVTIEVTNAAPLAADQAVALPEDTTTNLALIATDAEGDPLSFAIVTGPTNGSLSGFNPATGEVTYTPTANFNGLDSFTFQAGDGLTNSGIATVNLTITPVSDAPAAAGQTVSIPEDTATNLVLTASDLEGDPLTYVITTGPSNGSLSGFNPVTGAVTYTPHPDFTGGDNFTFRASDGVSQSAVATVTITVLPMNDDPVAVADVASTTKNTPVTVNVLDNDYDVDGDPLTVTAATATNGLVTIVGGTNLFFMPASNFVGYATMTYSITDGQGGFASAPGSVIIAVGTNAPPVAVDDHLSTPEDTEIAFDPRSNDYDLDDEPLTIITASATSGAVSTLGGTNLVFLPDTNFTGLATINYSIADTNGAMGSARIWITVTPVNDPPAMLDDVITMDEDSVIAIPVLVNDSDPDGDSLTVVSCTTTNGTTTVVGTNVVHTPDLNYFGTNLLTYCATDGTATNCASITVVVLPVNDAPLAIDQNVTTPEDTATNLVLTATDVDNTDLEYAILAGPANGGLSGLDTTTGAVIYAPEANYSGPDSFTFTVFDGSLYATGSVSITVLPVNDAPQLDLAIPDQGGVYGTPFSYSFPTNAFTDVDAGQTLTITASNLPPGITFDGPARTFSGTPSMAGLFVVTVIATDDGTPNLSAYDTFNFTVLAAPLTVTAADQTRAYGEANPPFTYTLGGFVLGDTTNVVSGVPVLGTSAGLSSPVGAYPITVALGTLAASNYTFAPVNGTLTVTSAPVLLTWTPDSPVVYGTPLGTNQLNAVASVPGTFAYDPDNGVVLNAGTNTLGVVFTPTDTNYIPASLNADLVVLPAPLTVAADDKTRVYGAANPPLTFSYWGFVNGEDASVISGAPVLSTSADPSSPVGAYPITVGLGTLVASNYTFTPASGSLAVTSAPVVLAWTPDSPVLYGTPLGTNQLNAVASVPGTFAYDPDNGVVLNAGTNILGVVFTPTDTNHSPASLTTPLVVLPATIEVAALDVVRAYGQPNPLLTFLLSGFVSGENASVVAGQLVLSTTATTASPVGAYPITVGLGALVSSNYVFVFSPGTLTITNARPAVDWTPASPIVYGTPLGSNQLNATSSEAGTYVYNPAYGTVLNAGTNLLQLTFTPADTNYTPVDLSAPLVLLPATLGVRADDKTRIYNQTNPPLTFTCAGFVNGENASVLTGEPLLSTPATASSPVGMYPIEVALGTLASGNYTFALTNGTLSVVNGFGIRPGTNVLNPQTGLYEQTVIVTNTSPSTVAALRLLVGDFASTNGTLRTNVWLWNAHGTSFDGRRYVQYNSPLDPGRFVSLKLEFYNPTRVPFTNSLEAEVTLPTPSTNLTGGVTIDRVFTDTRTAGDTRIVIEWTSSVGRNYTIIYGPTANGPWTAATPAVTATSTRTQWYDDGPPKTDSKPMSSSSRYYRVILNP